MQKHLAAGAVVGAFLIGTVGAALVLPKSAEAADPSPSPAATAAASAAPVLPDATTTTPAAPDGTTAVPAAPDCSSATGGPGGPGDRGGDHGGPGGLDADDLTAAAGALGMTEADLTTALQGGKTVAQVATDKGVDLQKVIDAIVAADTAEIAAAVTAGTMTQAQADERLANLAAHVTDEVNGVADGPGGRGGQSPDGRAPDGQAPPTLPAASPTV